MIYGGAEDRLNPVAPDGAEEGTLGGYIAIHGRAVAFEAADGRPYTVALEAEEADDGSGAWTGYLLFLRWADTGTAIMGHLDTGDLVRGATEDHVRAALEALPLAEVKRILEETLRRADDTSA